MSSNMLKMFILTVIVVTSNSFDWSQRYNLYIGQSKFAVTMMQLLAQDHPHENVLLSAHTTYRSLLLAFMGAKGETWKSMKAGLFLDWIETADDFDFAMFMEMEARAAHDLRTGIEFDSVNKLYVTKNATIG